ncbi:N-acetylmuramoyl-L-alanine amidase [Mobilitalea sibirica]|uniref:N-acetylmuramoyl-L-alanine amidase n=1 Tax=Mobilitalea sibirica TaxID=1462919 RepID=A0A8J7KRI9_9FIRM|nr:N-acetylmuramoyl-L-alanine amidase [Mobilitalea sibirica]MBH1939336.1 N-acetylmuramoyl-L-alanine amidase [Mobilitalea sibirica]
MPKIKIAIDAGHGSNTGGKRTPPFTKDVDINRDGIIDIKKGEQYREHYANVGVAKLLYSKLEARGYDVIRTGWDDANANNDKDDSLSSRQRKIKGERCDYSISIHFNAYGNGDSFNSANGYGVYIHSKNPSDSKLLADYVIRELGQGTPQRNRGIRAARLAMCNCKTMKTKASILCELAFMTNEYEASELMANAYFWEECAQEIANAVDRYCNCNNEEVTDKNGITKLYHNVVWGDTLSALAIANKTTVNRLVELNDIKNPDLIYVGQKLLVAKYVNYTVKSGDTLSRLSLKYLGDASRYDLIMAMNDMKSTRIFVNQILKIPVN